MLNREWPPELRFFPADAGLEQDVREAIDRQATRGDGVRVGVEADLRSMYPNLVIHAQHELAQVETSRRVTWYVLRDGRILARHERADRLYRALWEARQECRRSDIALTRALRLASLVAGEQRVDGAVHSAFEAVHG